MTQISKALKRLEPWLPLRENASFSGAFDAIYSGAHADIVTLWQDALAREEFWQKQKQDLDGEWGAQAKDSRLQVVPEDSQRRFFDPLYEKARELEAEKAQLEAALAREERKSEALSEKVEEGRSDLDAARENAEHYQVMFDATERQRDEWKARADDLDKRLAKVMSDYQDVEDERDEAEARTAPAVTKADIERTVAKFRIGEESEEDFIRPTTRVSAITEAVWEELLSGDDPPFCVVRESELPDVEQDEDGWTDGTRHGWEGTPETAMECVEIHLEWARFYAAVARAIEAEQEREPEPDPVEVAIRSGLSVWGTTDEAVERIAESVRRVLGTIKEQQ